MTIKFLNGYWTIFSGRQAIMTCASLEQAVSLANDTASQCGVAVEVVS